MSKYTVSVVLNDNTTQHHFCDDIEHHPDGALILMRDPLPEEQGDITHDDLIVFTCADDEWHALAVAKTSIADVQPATWHSGMVQTLSATRSTDQDREMLVNDAVDAIQLLEAYDGTFPSDVPTPTMTAVAEAEESYFEATGEHLVDLDQVHEDLPHMLTPDCDQLHPMFGTSCIADHDNAHDLHTDALGRAWN